MKIQFDGDESMNREELERYILNNYNTKPDYPWKKYPDYAVFRHSGSRKWFAVMMNVPKKKLGLQGADMLDIVNFKCEPFVVGALRMENGFFPAYHMNKENWITAALDGSVSDEKIKMLLDMSYTMTAPKNHRKF